jgi:hypothetical protein
MNANQKKEILNLLYSAIACLESNDPHFNSAAAWRLADASGLLREELPVGVGSLIGRDEPSGRGFILPTRIPFESKCTCGPVKHWECNAGCKAEFAA